MRLICNSDETICILFPSSCYSMHICIYFHYEFICFSLFKYQFLPIRISSHSHISRNRKMHLFALLAERTLGRNRRSLGDWGRVWGDWWNNLQFGGRKSRKVSCNINRHSNISVIFIKCIRYFMLHCIFSLTK